MTNLDFLGHFEMSSLTGLVCLFSFESRKCRHFAAFYD